MAISCPSPSWSVLLCRIVTRSPSGTCARSATSRADQLGAPECSGKTKCQERPVPLANECVGAMLQHLADQVRCSRCLILRRRADGAADPAHDGLHHFGVGRRLRISGELDGSRCHIPHGSFRSADPFLMPLSRSFLDAPFSIPHGQAPTVTTPMAHFHRQS
jgi:hypothetical protein